MPRVLIAGETFGLHLKGVATYQTGGYATGLDALQAALEAAGWDVVHIPNHLATLEFPGTIEALAGVDVVVLSDIPADTLLLHPDTFDRGLRTPDRLSLLADWVAQGGGLLMVGGYMSFSGFEGKGRYQNTALAEVLPVRMLGHDDRIEAPAGVVPRQVADHPVLHGITGEWPYFLGYNRLLAKVDASVPLAVGEDPFLALGSHGRGRVAAFASDCSPHWGSPAFLEWPSYGPFWTQLLCWTAGLADASGPGTAQA
ncbi:glutamine amidotransferase [soil metagenome]